MSDFYLYQTGRSQGVKLSAVNRSFDVQLRKIVKEHQLADGSTKTDLVARKLIFNFSWEWIANLDGFNADEGMGVDDLDDLVEADNSLVLKVPMDDGSYSTYTVQVSGDFKKSRQLIKKTPLGQLTWDQLEARYTWDQLEAQGWYWDDKSYWNVSLSLEEV